VLLVVLLVMLLLVLLLMLLQFAMAQHHLQVPLLLLPSATATHPHAIRRTWKARTSNSSFMLSWMV
jgi:hypothetical protein